MRNCKENNCVIFLSTKFLEKKQQQQQQQQQQQKQCTNQQQIETISSSILEVFLCWSQ